MYQWKLTLGVVAITCVVGLAGVGCGGGGGSVGGQNVGLAVHATGATYTPAGVSTADVAVPPLLTVGL
ncbi:MAG: hypothetical protein KAW89_10525, partial [Armatimonadetes bacterium]|nr:hypothetical protein [Armatimonadota bacterium]